MKPFGQTMAEVEAAVLKKAEATASESAANKKLHLPFPSCWALIYAQITC